VIKNVLAPTSSAERVSREIAGCGGAQLFAA
jgi:hypothetical protein